MDELKQNLSEITVAVEQHLGKKTDLMCNIKLLGVTDNNSLQKSQGEKNVPGNPGSTNL